MHARILTIFDLILTIMKLRIYLADLTHTSGLLPANEAFPLNVGLIASYCKKNFNNDVDIKLFKFPKDLKEAIDEKVMDLYHWGVYVCNFAWEHHVEIYNLYRKFEGAILAKKFGLVHQLGKKSKFSMKNWVTKPRLNNHKLIMKDRLHAYEKRLNYLIKKVHDLGSIPIFVTQSKRRTYDFVDGKLKEIMSEIHSSCLAYGKEKNHIDYLKGANIAGFIKVADAMLAQGVV